jgi:hypothetical protein
MHSDVILKYIVRIFSTKQKSVLLLICMELEFHSAAESHAVQEFPSYIIQRHKAMTQLALLCVTLILHNALYSGPIFVKKVKDTGNRW